MAVVGTSQQQQDRLGKVHCTRVGHQVLEEVQSAVHQVQIAAGTGRKAVHRHRLVVSCIGQLQQDHQGKPHTLGN